MNRTTRGQYREAWIEGRGQKEKTQPNMSQSMWITRLDQINIRSHLSLCRFLSTKSAPQPPFFISQNPMFYLSI